MRFSVPDKYSPRRPAVRQKAVVFSPARDEWRVIRNGKLVKRKFVTREKAREYVR